MAHRLEGFVKGMERECDCLDKISIKKWAILLLVLTLHDLSPTSFRVGAQGTPTGADAAVESTGSLTSQSWFPLGDIAEEKAQIADSILAKFGLKKGLPATTLTPPDTNAPPATTVKSSTTAAPATTLAPAATAAPLPHPLHLQTGPNTSYSATSRVYSDYQVMTTVENGNGDLVLIVDFFTNNGTAASKLPDGKELPDLDIPDLVGAVLNDSFIDGLSTVAIFTATQVYYAMAMFPTSNGRKLNRALLDSPGCDNFFDTDCTIPCCAQHDKCYHDNGCTAASWFLVIGAGAPDAPPEDPDARGPRCSTCNAKVLACILYNFIALTCDQCAQAIGVGTSCYDKDCDTFYDCPGACPCFSLTPTSDGCCDCESPCSAQPSTTAAMTTSVPPTTTAQPTTTSASSTTPAPPITTMAPVTTPTAIPAVICCSTPDRLNCCDPAGVVTSYCYASTGGVVPNQCYDSFILSPCAAVYCGDPRCGVSLQCISNIG